jgi:hypothetical protein
MKEIKQLVGEIASKFNLAINKEDAINKNQDKYIYCEFASCYGGYRLVMVGVSNGGHYGAFNESSCCSRRGKKEMVSYLNGLLNS